MDMCDISKITQDLTSSRTKHNVEIGECITVRCLSSEMSNTQYANEMNPDDIVTRTIYSHSYLLSELIVR